MGSTLKCGDKGKESKIGVDHIDSVFMFSLTSFLMTSTLLAAQSNLS